VVIPVVLLPLRTNKITPTILTCGDLYFANRTEANATSNSVGKCSMSEQTIQSQYDPQPISGPIGAGGQLGLRMWPGVLLVAALWLVRAWSAIGEFAMYKFFVGLVIAPLVVLVALLIWWMFASRLRWSDRWLGLGTLIIVALISTIAADASFRGMAMVVYSLPLLETAWIGWLVLSFALPWPIRRAGVLLVLVTVGTGSCLLRVDGLTGDFAPKFNWRWTLTPEQKLLAKRNSQLATASALPTTVEVREQPGDWTGFRGRLRDSRLSGVRVKTDWRQAPPRELWRNSIGPGWSSFAVLGDRLFTQEQRGGDEYVVCYEAATGNEVWTRHDATRFYEMIGGPGPRATPTFHAGRVFSFGANGHLNCLDAASGKVSWSRDVAADSGAAIPQWGFASSPLVAQGLVTVFAGGPSGKSMVAYREDSGEPAWSAGVDAEGAGSGPELPILSYSSPQLSSIDGVEQILLSTNAGVSAFEPVSGKRLWQHSWNSDKIVRIVQPAVIGANDVLIGTGLGIGTRRIHIQRDAEKWDTKELWTTRKIKPYFSDFVVLRDHIYGFDGSKFLCVSLEKGNEIWRASGYGNGQVLLLVDQELLLIVSEEGEVALVSARPDKYEELGRFKAIEGKTWNHPVVAHGKLFVRNGEEIACFQLDREGAGAAKKAAEIGP
jgi:outer membrane protein assembly factor BamB